MYERFTDRARKVLQLANMEAQRFNHTYIGTEHMLLGLVKEASGLPALKLQLQGISAEKVRLEIEKIVRPGPDMTTMGKLPQTPRAKKVVEIALQHAQDLNDNDVGTDHLLYGLLQEKEGVAARVLINLGVKLFDMASTPPLENPIAWAKAIVRTPQVIETDGLNAGKILANRVDQLENTLRSLLREI